MSRYTSARLDTRNNHGNISGSSKSGHRAFPTEPLRNDVQRGDRLQLGQGQHAGRIAGSVTTVKYKMVDNLQTENFNSDLYWKKISLYEMILSIIFKFLKESFVHCGVKFLKLLHKIATFKDLLLRLIEMHTQV